jgi:hypothetical protein
MSCRSCRANDQVIVLSETSIHLETLSDLTVPSVLMFPELVVCLQCGFTEFQIEGQKLREIADRIGAYSSRTNKDPREANTDC